MDTKRVDEPGARRLRRVLVVAGSTLAALILVAVAIYAVAFLLLAPMMQ
ncbi:MAG: hypothetical protein VYB90_19065 [Actinomycetota bacterium]|nr:hypothetical protein [Actinomycetota bacterium]